MSRTGATYKCRYCKDAVDIPESIALAFFKGGGVAAIRAEQSRHLATCEPAMSKLGARVVAGVEDALKEAVS